MEDSLSLKCLKINDKWLRLILEGKKVGNLSEQTLALEAE
jgi:hypothetical protein